MKFRKALHIGNIHPVFACLAAILVLSVEAGCMGSGPELSQVPVVAPAAFDLAAVARIIKEKNDRFTAAHITGDTTVLNDYYAPDARVLAPNTAPVEGRAAIARMNDEYVSFGITEAEEATTRIYGNADFVVDEGNYRMRYGKDSTLESGKYLNVWKNADGEWRVYTNTWSPNN